jgi:hypothetical protein
MTQATATRTRRRAPAQSDGLPEPLEKSTKFAGFMAKAIDQTFAQETVPEMFRADLGKIMGMMHGIDSLPVPEQLAMIRRTFRNPNRPGGDCDAWGSWQPRFFFHLFDAIAKDAGMTEEMSETGLTNAPMPKGKWQMRQYLDGE